MGRQGPEPGHAGPPANDRSEPAIERSSIDCGSSGTERPTVGHRLAESTACRKITNPGPASPGQQPHFHRSQDGHCLPRPDPQRPGRKTNQWAQYDAPAALAWAQTLPASQQKNFALQQAASIWAQNDPKAAVAYLGNLPDGPQKNNLIQNMASQWAQSDPTSALAWAEDLPSSQTKMGALRQITSSWAQSDPQAATAYVMGLPEGKLKNEVISGLAPQLAASDVNAAVDLVNKYTTGQARDQAMQASDFNGPRPIRRRPWPSGKPWRATRGIISCATSPLNGSTPIPMPPPTG